VVDEPGSSRRSSKGRAKPSQGRSERDGLRRGPLEHGEGTACWQFSNVKNIAKPTQAHIHRGAEGVSGPIVIVFGTSYGAKGCAKAAKGLIEKIETNPNRYYVNIHNAATGRGAIRGQLVVGMEG
jgi:hypothetical protein